MKKKWFEFWILFDQLFLHYSRLLFIVSICVFVLKHYLCFCCRRIKGFTFWSFFFYLKRTCDLWIRIKYKSSKTLFKVPKTLEVLTFNWKLTNAWKPKVTFIDSSKVWKVLKNVKGFDFYRKASTFFRLESPKNVEGFDQFWPSSRWGAPSVRWRRRRPRGARRSIRNSGETEKKRLEKSNYYC